MDQTNFFVHHSNKFLSDEILSNEFLSKSIDNEVVSFIIHEYSPDGTVDKRVVEITLNEALDLKEKLFQVDNPKERFSLYKQFGVIPKDVNTATFQERMSEVERSIEEDIIIEKNAKIREDSLSKAFRIGKNLHVINDVNCTISGGGSTFTTFNFQVGPFLNLISRLNFFLYSLTADPFFGGGFTITTSSTSTFTYSWGDRTCYLLFGSLSDYPPMFQLVALKLSGFEGVVIKPPPNIFGFLEEIYGNAEAVYGYAIW